MGKKNEIVRMKNEYGEKEEWVWWEWRMNMVRKKNENGENEEWEWWEWMVNGDVRRRKINILRMKRKCAENKELQMRIYMLKIVANSIENGEWRSWDRRITILRMESEHSWAQLT